jgi:hypothetical protein
MPVTPHDPDNPSRRCYQRGCRHPECVLANRDYGRVYRQTTQPEYWGQYGYDVSDIIDDLAIMLGSK